MPQVLPYFVIVFPLLYFFFLILYFPVCYQKALQGIFFFFFFLFKTNDYYLTFWQYCLLYKQGTEKLDTEHKNGRMELEDRISSCRILFQEGSTGYGYWTDTYFLLNSFISSEQNRLQTTGMQLRIQELGLQFFCLYV